MIVPATVRLSGLQATVDSKAAQMRVRSPEAGGPVAAHRGVTVVQAEVPVVQAEVVEAPAVQAAAVGVASGVRRLLFTKV